MGRVKVSMEPMKDRKKRNETFHRRKEGMIKKALELTTLCDVNVSMIIYNHPHETPQFFPPDLDKFNSSLNLYEIYRSTDRGKIKSYDLSGFFKDRKVKIEEQLEKAKKKNLETKYPTCFDFLDDSQESLRDFASGLGDKINNVKNRLEYLKKTFMIQNLYENRSPIMTMISPIDCNNYGFFPPMAEFIGENQYQYQNNTMNLQYSSNPNLVNTNTMMKMLMSDDYKECPMMPMNGDLSKFDIEELWNPSYSMMEMLMSEDDFHFPLPEFCFQSEILQQQSCVNSNEFLMSEFGSSQVMGV